MTLELFSLPPISPLHFEQQARRRGYPLVAGVDEAGRGPLAGPVVAAAVVLPESFDLPGLNDSKQLTAGQRQRLFPLIRRQALAIGLGVATAAEIDQLNILQATLRAMLLAVRRLRLAPDFLLVDGNQPVPLPLPQQTLIKGDGRSLSIAAASIVAKVVRDRMMAGYDRHFPGYGFAGHKGYGCAAHRQAIALLGPSPQHRTTFSGVREYLR
ncbi:MAG: ribonuclease HII [Desulfuromonadales bacterium]|nr:ribonuclease HII [Desulfuromonadales bacterium]